MVRKATALFLVLTTLAGPFICCCTTAKAFSWVSVCLGYEPVSCASSQCCHETAVAHQHSHGAKHHHHHHHGDGHKHQHPDAGQLAGKTRPNDQGSGSPEQCPCRQDGNQIAGVPITDNLAAQAINASLNNFAWATFTLYSAAISMTSFESGSIASSPCPANIFLNGQEILRAYCVLRI